MWNIIFLLSFFFKIPPEKSVRSILLDRINYWWESGEQETIPWIFPDLHTNPAPQRRNKFLEAIKKVTWSIDSLLWRIVSWFSSPKTFHFIFRTRIEFLIKLINRANYFFFARASFFQLEINLKNRFIRKGNFREKIGHGKERGLELFTNSCHFIENENMWTNMKESYSVVKPFLTRFPRFFVTGPYHERLHLSERWVSWKYIRFRGESSRQVILGRGRDHRVALKRSHLVVPGIRPR